MRISLTNRLAIKIGTMPVNEFLQTIGERLQTAATVKSVYGEPITAGERVLIPVARVRFGFGAGGGSRKAPDSGENGGSGGGGGGGVRCDPAGVLEVTPAGSVFKVFPDYRQIGIAFGVGVLAGLLLKRRKS